ncbi:hypothetical protein [Streptomyces sp. NPDC020917]|uniref:endo-beta-N-acetylglucosaminidase n=1 Tax=Streptomyces sp. NPDC020917 TaxID=3365102 RepID=UPI0037A32BC5
MSDRKSPEPRLPFTMHRRGFLTAAGATLMATAAGTWGGRTAAAAEPQPRGAAPAGAAPSFPPTQTELQPGSPAGVQALLAYDADADPNAPYMRSHVQRARRIDLPASTQANPRLSPRPQVLVLNPFYDQLQEDMHAIQDTRYGFDRYPYITRFAQYQDYVCGWNGAQNVPNTAYVDAAHRNGALALGIVFQPYFSPAPGADTDFIAKDSKGNYLVGDKLVDLAAYFGYDGYFLNIEGMTITRGQADDLAAMFESMHARAHAKGMPDFYLQVYDALWTDGSGEYENRFDEHNAGWIVPGREVDSMFINYAWPQNFPQQGWTHPEEDYVAPSVALAEQRGLDPFQTLFFGLDIGEENDGVHANAVDYYAEQVIPLNGERPPVASLALFVQTDRTIQRTRAELGSQASDLAALQEAVHIADRRFWSGKAENPAVPATPVHPTVEQVLSPDWVPQYGIANFITERSVVGTLPFTTRFNTGQGDRFFLRGAQAGKRVWYSLSIQDVLPTWQWWTRDLDGKTGAEGLLHVDYDQSVAYDGGSSLRLSGPLSQGGGTEVRLFKTAIDADRPVVVSLLVRDGSPGSTGLLRVGVSYADAPDRTVWLTARGRRADEGGWRRLEFEAAPRHGGLITAVSVGVVAPSDSGAPLGDCSVYVGELRIAAPGAAQRPSVPTGLRVDASAPSAGGSGLTVGLRWRSASEGVWYYDLRTVGASPQWLGRISGDAYVLDAIVPGTRVALVAVAPDGTESEPAVVTVR